MRRGLVELLDTIKLADGRRVELWQGDLADLNRDEWYDAIVVSAYQGNFYPNPPTLIGALHRQGVSVEALSRDKAEDLTQEFGTWMSQPVRSDLRAIGFERVICFEPGWLGRPPEVVGHFFRALVPLLASHPKIRSMAMPVLSTGNMGYAIEEMLPPILDAAINLLEHGGLLDRLAIVVRSEVAAEAAEPLFAAAKQGINDYDVFISYAHEDGRFSTLFERTVQEKRAGTRFFVDRVEIDHGAAWQRRIFESLDRCRLVVCLLSPDYLRSDVCLEEFNIAWMRDRKEGRAILRPIFLRGDHLPTYMESRQYADCRTDDEAMLAETAARIAGHL